MNYDSRKEIESLLQERGLGMKKRFGQNFLINKGVREQIVRILSPAEDHTLWEIGPGIGAMTHMLLDRCAKLNVFEIDRGFITFLKEEFGGRNDFEIIEGDVLKTWPEFREENPMPDRLIGNLPYNVGSVIIASLIEADYIPDKMVFVVQKEVAQRMTAVPGTKNFSSFSLLCQFACKVVCHGDIKSGSFYPAPDVVSSIVEFTPHGLYKDVDRKAYFALIRDLFRARRKTVLNNISSGGFGSRLGKDRILAALEAAGVKPQARGETLSVETVIRLSEALAAEDNRL